MAITKESVLDKIEIVGDYKHVQLKKIITIKEDGEVLSVSNKRSSFAPSAMKQNVDSDGELDGTVTHTPTDMSGEDQSVQDVCVAVWTDAVKAAWKAREEELSNIS